MKIAPAWRPTLPATAKLFLTGATVGPVVDSLHNQCLLYYNVAPISIEWPQALSHLDGALFKSSWTVFPLLGIAYVVLGGILPRLFQLLVDSVSSSNKEIPDPSINTLRTKAILAVTTTAAIIKLSDFLERNPSVTDGLPIDDPAEQHIFVLLVAALAQWAWLDGTLPALLAASLTSIGGPLSELPFVADHVWVYLQSAGDYLPLQHVTDSLGILRFVLGDDYQQLALSSITGPCYFAVTMDAIALGRWFDAQSRNEPDSKDSLE